MITEFLYLISIIILVIALIFSVKKNRHLKDEIMILKQDRILWQNRAIISEIRRIKSQL